MKHVKTVILGAGAAGLMCAAHAGRDVLLIDHAKRAGEKIRISGGGRCNFTNLDVTPKAYISQNPHFVKSALKRYTQWDFIDLIAQYDIAYHEKTLGQLFCDQSAKDIVSMLEQELAKAQALMWLKTDIIDVIHRDGRFILSLEREGKRIQVSAQHLVIATGGKSIPKMGATGFAYSLASQFGLNMIETRAGLVPFTFDNPHFAACSGISFPSSVSCNEARFKEALLLTHRGLSGPAILQASSYWREGQPISIDFLPEHDIFTLLKQARHSQGKKAISTVLSGYLPNRFIDALKASLPIECRLADQSDKTLAQLCEKLHGFDVLPSGTQGYRTAEVTMGGVDTDELSSKTFEAKKVPNLYFIGECIDVTGWLGGYNFQWAWSSAWCAAHAIVQNDA